MKITGISLFFIFLGAAFIGTFGAFEVSKAMDRARRKKALEEASNVVSEGEPVG